jgi:hypothetical protein
VNLANEGAHREDGINSRPLATGTARKMEVVKGELSWASLQARGWK